MQFIVNQDLGEMYYGPSENETDEFQFLSLDGVPFFFFVVN